MAEASTTKQLDLLLHGHPQHDIGTQSLLYAIHSSHLRVQSRQSPTSSHLYLEGPDIPISFRQEDGGGVSYTIRYRDHPFHRSE